MDVLVVRARPSTAPLKTPVHGALELTQACPRAAELLVVGHVETRSRLGVPVLQAKEVHDRVLVAAVSVDSDKHHFAFVAGGHLAECLEQLGARRLPGPLAPATSSNCQNSVTKEQEATGGDKGV